ncbi:MAG: phosphomannomutase/phosphoglucomutase [Methylococcales bacterium]|nr:phosphomannomutase/phosphoglucomutase [Methylococcales bacterium]
MARIFGIAAAFTIAMIVLSSLGVFWVSTITSEAKEESKQELTNSAIKVLAYTVYSQVKLLEKQVAQLATDRDVIAATESADRVLLENIAYKFQTQLPYALKVRICLLGIDRIDETAKPYMGQADLFLVQKTFESKQLSAVQGQGINRHFAITAAIKRDNQIIGVILASLDVNFLRRLFKNSPIENNFVMLKQRDMTVAKIGDVSMKNKSFHVLKIPDTRWQLDYWPYQTNQAGQSVVVKKSSLPRYELLTVIIIGVSLLTCLIYFFGYYQVRGLLRQDQKKLIYAIKDLRAGKDVSHYSMHLIEMKVIIATLAKFKRSHKKQLKRKNPPPPTIAPTKEKLSPPLPKSIAQSKEEPNPEPLLEAESKKSLKTTINPTIPDKIAPPYLEETIFKVYGIQGIAGKNLSKTKVYEIGLAIGSEVKNKGRRMVVVAKDGRLSSDDLIESLVKGLISTGCNVLDLGQIPTPLLYFITHHVGGRSGVMITGGHLASEYNGLKVVINGEILAGEKIQQLRQRIEDERYITGSLGTVEKNDSYGEEYIGTICDDIELKRNLKVIVDCGNGIVGKIISELLENLGCDVTLLYNQVDGHFPNHLPDPTNPENFKELINKVKNDKADVGLSFDGDGNRLGVVDSQGKIIWTDRQMMLFSKQILGKQVGAEIIYDIKCSQHLGEYIKKQGGRPIMWKAGHSFLKEKMQEKSAVLIGGMSGNIAFNDRWFGFDDALYSAARLLEILAADKRSSHEVFAELPDSINTAEILIEIAENEKFPFIAEFIKRADFPDATLIDIDGLRIEFDDGWALVRASNSSSSIMLRFEADNQEALLKIQQRIKQLMSEINQGIKIPF